MTIAYKKLIAWEKADILARKIYKVTLKFPKSEMYGINSQLRRSSLSVVLNIIEGYARNNKKEFRNFLRIAYASLVEVEYLLDFSFQQKYLSSEEYSDTAVVRNECGKVLWKLLKSQS